MIEQKDFLDVINLLELNYDKKMKDEIIKIWYDEFKDYGKDLFRKCVVEVIKSDMFFPTINRVKEFADKCNEFVDESGFTHKNGRRLL